MHLKGSFDVSQRVLKVFYEDLKGFERVLRVGLTDEQTIITVLRASVTDGCKRIVEVQTKPPPDTRTATGVPSQSSRYFRWFALSLCLRFLDNLLNVRHLFLKHVVHPTCHASRIVQPSCPLDVFCFLDELLHSLRIVGTSFATQQAQQ